MSNHTNLTVREADDGDGDAFTDEAVLHYQRVTEEEKKKARGFRGPLPGEAATYSGAVGLGMAAVAFEDRQLHADLSTGNSRDDDPWGAEEDEYAVPTAVTGSDEDSRDKRRRGGPGMALRGSGTRGGSRGGNGSMAGGAPMVGAPGATVGGVGGAGAPGASAGMGAAPQLGMAQGNAAGSMPVNLLQGAQSSSRAATSAAYAPPMGGGGGLQAASAGPGAYDPDVLQEALKANGFLPGDETLTGPGTRAGSELVDTDGDGIPDTPRSEAERDAARDSSRQTGGGSHFLPAPGGGSGSGNQVGPAPTGPGGGSGPGGTGPGVSGPGGSGPGTGGNQSSTPVPTMPPAATGPTGPTVTPPASNPSTGSQTGPGTGAQSGGWQTPNQAAGPAAADGSNFSSSLGGPGFAQATPTYSGGGSGSGYSVTTDDLRRDSRDWAAVAEQSQPIAQAIIATPTPTKMFGHMSAPISTYRAAVETARDHVEQSGEQSMTVAVGLNETASNFDEQELAAIAETGRII